jgi:hypothetical protein
MLEVLVDTAVVVRLFVARWKTERSVCPAEAHPMLVNRVSEE